MARDDYHYNETVLAHIAAPHNTGAMEDADCVGDERCDASTGLCTTAGVDDAFVGDSCDAAEGCPRGGRCRR